MIRYIRKFIINNNLDGYIVPKNDNYFTEYSKVNNLNKISNFTGSAGFALILKKKNYLFVDGRYILQANRQSGKNFKIFQIPYHWPKNIENIQKLRIGFNPKLFTEKTLKIYFENKVNLIPLEFSFKNKIEKKENKIFTLNKSITGEDSKSKINKVKNYMKKYKIDYLFSSAGENVNWLLNIRGRDLPNSPLVNCKILIPYTGELYLFINKKKIPKFLKKNLKNIILCEEDDLLRIVNNLNNGLFCIDKNTCSIFDQSIISSKHRISPTEDPIYNLKSIKNKIEIKNTLKAHIEDGVAVTKFLYWFKKNKKVLNEKKNREKTS